MDTATKPAPEQVKVKPEYMVNMRGTTAPSYRGVLDAATQAGIQSLQVTHIQLPTDENGHEAVCQAILTMKDGRLFVDLGDACPGNVGPNIKPHILRMASTRAKGRVLRDAINIGEAIEEEFEAPTATPQRQHRNAEAVANRPVASEPGNTPAGAATGFTCQTKGCGVILTPEHAGDSQRKHGEILCPDCQPKQQPKTKKTEEEVWDDLYTRMTSDDDATAAAATASYNLLVQKRGADWVSTGYNAAVARAKAREAAAQPTTDDPFNGQPATAPA